MDRTDASPFMMDRLKNRIRKGFPTIYHIAASTKRRIGIEYLTVKRIGLLALLRKNVGNAKAWEKTFPLQAPMCIAIPGVRFTTADELMEYLRSSGVKWSSGKYAIYLPPASVDASAFRVTKDFYPPGFGLKIVRDPGRAANSNFVESVVQRKLSGGNRQLSLVANLLHARDIGPRLYDVVEMDCGGSIWTVYVVEHVDGRSPTDSECEEGIARIRQLEAEDLIAVLTENGYDNIDFQPPNCNGNALMDSKGRFRYIDFQAIAIRKYQPFLDQLARQAVGDVHFGDKGLFGGGSLLYQSVPGVSLRAKREIEVRIQTIRELMASTGVAVKDRLVLDVGCNTGMMMAQYLRLGAKWCHGWDMPSITQHAERLLFALGCTRFSTTSGEIRRDQDLEMNLPAFLRPSLNGCVISYLAIRGHVGWLNALATLPWSFMIYEGHEQDTDADFERYLSELTTLVGARVAKVSRYEDGISYQRQVALVTRDRETRT